VFEIPASLLAWFYSLVHNYAIAIAMITVVVMALLTPLTLKSTKGMLEMQRLQPELRKLQQQHKGDRQKLNEEMMKLYQEHKVNPLASCLPLLAQMPVFIIMYRVLRGLTAPATATQAAELGIDVGSFAPKFVSKSSELYQSLLGQTEMLAFGLDLSKSPSQIMQSNTGKGVIYAALVVLLAFLYWVQQRMIASRTVNPSMSAGQQKLMQYLPVGFAGFQLFFPTGLVIYYLTQTVIRIGQQVYITRRFYGHDESLGRQAQRAGDEARELNKKDKPKAAGPPGSSRPGTKAAPKPAPKPAPKQNGSSGRATPPKGSSKPQSGGPPQRPKPAPKPGTPSATRHPKPKK
jgi:YidC/Oxa1 family membrane protein insertase